MRGYARRLWSDELGQGLPEYSLILALVALAAIAALILMSGNVQGIFDFIRGAFDKEPETT